MAINKRFTDYELKIIHLALDQVFSTGKTDVVCPRCGGKLIGNRASSAYGIECENKCGIKASMRGL